MNDDLGCALIAILVLAGLAAVRILWLLGDLLMKSGSCS